MIGWYHNWARRGWAIVIWPLLPGAKGLELRMWLNPGKGIGMVGTRLVSGLISFVRKDEEF